MPTSIKRPQLRTCTTCKKPGHNSSTCPQVVTRTIITPTPTPPEPTAPIAPPQKTSAQPLHFFVHHVASESRHSPHVIDLKKQSFNVWETVEAVAPEKIQPTAEHLLQERPTLNHQSLSSQQSPVAASTSSSRPVHTPTLQTSEPIPTAKQVEISNVVEKKNITITIPTLHFSALKEKIKKSAKEQLGMLTYQTKNKLDTWRTQERRRLIISPEPARTIEQPASTSTPTPEPSPKKETVSWLKKGLSRYTLSEFFSQTDPWRRRLAVALVILLVISIVPAQAQTYYQTLQTNASSIAEKSTAGFLALQESTSALLSANLSTAEQSTLRALENFSGAVTILDKHRLLQKLVSVVPVLGDEIQSRQELLKAGQSITVGNTYLLKGIDSSLQTNNQELLEKLSTIVLHVRSALPHYKKARHNLEQVQVETLPLQYQTAFSDFKKIFISATNDFEQLANLGDTFQDLFGGKGLRRYLLIFQNPAEMRATGGFIGSFAEVDVKDGRITRFEVPAGGSYDVQGQLRKHIEPPVPLLMANKRWEFQDANWFPDFPASAEKLLWFYRHSERGSVDGIIALNASVLERLLSIIGPVSDPKRGITINQNNALNTLQAIVEEGDEKKINKPKQVLSDLSHIFINYFSSLSPKDVLPTLISLKEALDQKEIQVYLADTEYQKKLARFGWSGAILATTKEQDYLFVVNSNILGEKSDAKIKQSINHQAVVDSDGSIINTITITREHTGTPGEKFYGKPNINYVRVYVPRGATLLEAKGFSWPDEKNFRAPDAWTKRDETLSSLEHVVTIDDKTGTRVTEEFGKYAFGNWMVTEPGKITQVQLIYKLPITLRTLSKNLPDENTFMNKLLKPAAPVSTYQLIVQKQSGVKSAFDSTIIFPASWTPVWKDGDRLEPAKNGATISVPDLEKDYIWSIAMKKI